MERSVEQTAAAWDGDGDAYRALMQPFVKNWLNFYTEVLAPIHIPKRPLLYTQFGLRGLLATTWLMRRLFKRPEPRALFAGIAAHATLPLTEPPSAAFGLVLGVAGHAVGWPIPRGGTGAISRSFVPDLKSLGGEVLTNRRVESLDDVPSNRVVLLDVTARQILRLLGDRLPRIYRTQVEHFRYGLGTFKMDWVLDAPIPWRADACRRAATVHVGGTLEEVAQSHIDAWAGKIPERPFLIVAQPTLFDRSRVPDERRHIAWGYAHVPNGDNTDMSARIEAQIERFASRDKKTIIIKNAGHGLPLEKPAPTFRRKVGAWLSKRGF